MSDERIPRTLASIIAIIMAAVVGSQAAIGNIFGALLFELYTVGFYVYVVLFSTIWKGGKKGAER